MFEDKSRDKTLDDVASEPERTPKRNALDVDEPTHCEECSAHLVRDDTGDLVCSECGLVAEGQYDYRPRRAHGSEQIANRATHGPPSTPLLHDKGLPTEISWKNRDAYGKKIPSRNQAQVYRMRFWQRRIRVSDARERNLAMALGELERMASGMGLPKTVREIAAVFYRKAVYANLIRGRSIEGVVAASIYSACRHCKVPRTLDEIATASAKANRKEIGRTYRFMSRELKLKLLPTDPASYVSRFCSELGLSGKTQSKTGEIIKRAKEKELTGGRGPIGICAAAIYMSSILCNERRTQKEIAEKTGVTEVTVRNRYKELSEKLEIYVPV